LLEEGVSLGFLLRSAITFGKVKWDSRLTFGKAIVDAYNIANRQNWIGTVCEKAFSDLWPSIWDFDLVVRYPVPMKQGNIEQLPAVSWNVLKPRFSCGSQKRDGLDWSR
jgi:hypothetical protein